MDLSAQAIPTDEWCRRVVALLQRTAGRKIFSPIVGMHLFPPSDGSGNNLDAPRGDDHRVAPTEGRELIYHDIKRAASAPCRGRSFMGGAASRAVDPAPAPQRPIPQRPIPKYSKPFSSSVLRG